MKKTETTGTTPKPVARKTKSATATRAAKPSALKKTALKIAPGKSTSVKKLNSHLISDKDIELRAYFISENRSRKGIPGDPAQDWLEAECQLIAERN